MLARLPVAALLALAACARLPDPGRLADGGASIDMPAEFRADHVLVQTVLGARDTAWLLLDSGAQLVVLDRALVDRLDVEAIGRSTLTGFGADTVRGQVVPALPIAPPGAHPFPLTVPVADLSGVRPYAGFDLEGFLGAPFFFRYVIEIDYPRRRVTLHDADAFRPRAGDVALELEVEEGVPFVDGALELADGSTLAGRFVFDTGLRNAVSLTTSFVARHDLARRIGATVPQRTAGIGGVTDFRIGRVAAITLGGVRVDAPTVEFAPDGAGIAGAEDRAGAIGSALLRRFVVTIDFRRERAYLRDSGVAATIDADLSGASFVATGADLRTIVVDRVDERSPAERAGLRSGDALLELDGRSAPDIALWDVYQTMRSEPGRRLPIVVRRDSETVRLELVLERRV